MIGLSKLMLKSSCCRTLSEYCMKSGIWSRIDTTTGKFRALSTAAMSATIPNSNDKLYQQGASQPLAYSIQMIEPVLDRLLTNIRMILREAFDGVFDGIFNIKRTFQPSLIRRKRKHGFLARANDRHGRKILARRKLKQRQRLCS